MAAFNTRMQEARKAAGLTLDDVLVAVRTKLPTVLQASRATLARLEQDRPEGKADPLLVQFLASLYGIPFEELSPTAAAALNGYRDVVVDLTRSVTNELRDEAIVDFPCSQESRPLALAGAAN